MTHKLSNENIRSLTKRQLLTLPGFDSKSTLSQLKQQLTTKLNELNINRRGIKVRDYIKAYNDKQRHDDNELFNRITKDKQSRKRNSQKQQQYKQQLKQTAIDEREMMNINPQYQTTKSAERRYYEENVNDKRKFEREMKQMMNDAKHNIGYEVDIGDDSERLYAFSKVLRYLHSHFKSTNKVKPFIQVFDLSGRIKRFTLSNSLDIDNLVNNLLGTIDVESQFSGDAPEIVNEAFQVDRIEVQFVEWKKGKGKRKTFIGKMRDSQTNRIHPQEFEVVDDFRDRHDGSFFPYINTTHINLESLQIFNTVDKKNYRDSCFVYACIQSKVFTKDEIERLRSMMQTRSLSNDKVSKISQEFKCNFVIKRIDENKSVNHQTIMQVDTRKREYGKTYTRCVELLLFKNHYMLNKKLPITTYYIKHMEELDLKFSHIPLKRRQLISGLNKRGSPKYEQPGELPITILRAMFRLKLFREINECENNILSTVEFDNHLNDYVELDYPENLCCLEENAKIKNPTKWGAVYYADFETDTTAGKHIPYLCCVCREINGKKYGCQFMGPNISTKLLDYLETNSLTYFHNLKYDACFFINEPGWQISITERTGTVLQVDMTKYAKIIDKKTGKSKSIRLKHLTFRNSYSIIPQPLSKFADMFKLNVHKELMPYKLYTQHNLERKKVSALEFQLQYFHENYNNIGFKQCINNMHQLIENAKIAKAYDKDNMTVDIMKYATFYCMKDCVVLMDGMNKFNDDISKVFDQSNTPFIGIHQFLSISAVGYDFARIYGCFDGCYRLSGKPQNFIQRCVNGGRTMTANNQKQYIVDRLQDFDAVSLYPSAMSIMDGIPKGKPHVIPKNITHEQLMNYDTFFIEINITSLKCKSTQPYAFGQVFTKTDKKLYGNEPVNNYYVDKITLLDLLEFYDIEYEFIRGYYFNDGFNREINNFITMLFNLRLKYKKESNPLEQTIKLLLNSIYGKSILKPMKDEVKVVDCNKLTSYLYRNYNFIKEITIEDGISKAYVKRIKPINNHFNLPQFGASVLSWSKHIMNQVMCTAEQHDIPIYYQDTDSMHLRECDVSKLAELYKNKYGKTLIGKSMGQFHCDFDSFDGSHGEIHSRKLIALGKKSYLDILVDEAGNEGYHIRMKSIPNQCILNKCQLMGITVEELYERMYNGEAIEFDLTDGTNCFKKTKTFDQITLQHFIRRVQF